METRESRAVAEGLHPVTMSRRLSSDLVCLKSSRVDQTDPPETDLPSDQADPEKMGLQRDQEEAQRDQEEVQTDQEEVLLQTGRREQIERRGRRDQEGRRERRGEPGLPAPSPRRTKTPVLALGWLEEW